MRCISCHNSTLKAGKLDLSTRPAAEAAGVFVKGANGSSKLMTMVESGKMPPTGKLPDEEIALVRRWTAAGAKYPQAKLEPMKPRQKPLWSMQPIRLPAFPKTPFDAFSTNPIDRFIFAKLAANGLKPSPLAGRAALLRRITFDLTGLPPTPQEVSDFLKDKRPDAYERVVDRLLASPAYGERWGRHWLDVARYGESHGYEQNHLRPNAWPYRDYVIRAFNQDKPYNRFIAEQLAGDTLAKGNPEVEAATGFLVAGIHDTVGNSTEEGTRQQRINDLEDMVSTTGAAFLGLTVGCARCHDHKFDPIAQRDFYRLAACFAGVRHGERPLHVRELTENEKREQAQVQAKLLEIQNGLNELEGSARNALLKHTGRDSNEQIVSPDSRPAINSRRNEDTFPPTATRFIRFTILATNDGAEPCLDELQVFGDDPAKNLALSANGGRASANSLLPGYAEHQIAHLNDGMLGNSFSWISKESGTGWAQIELPDQQSIRKVVWSRDGGEIHRFDDRLPVSYRIEISLDGKTWKIVSTEAGRSGSNNYIHPDRILAAMTPEQREKHTKLQQALAETKRRAALFQNTQNAYIGQFSSPDLLYLLNRGDVMQRGEEMKPGALSKITELPSELILPDSTEPQRRLALANWIIDPRNPLTARVMVNRIWQHHFGRGIVGTPSDFGRNGEPPTHPELLDWLASAFVNKYEWKLKPLHRLLVTSYAYRQSSAPIETGLEKDAGNRLIWRMELRRLEAEAIRDSILATSGVLKRQIGGPSYQLFKYTVVNVAIYEPLENPGPETWRRSVYQMPARSIRDDLLGAFDCPESSQRAPRRDSTTTALQALSLLNGDFMTQQSTLFAKRIESEAGQATMQEQIDRAFALAFTRTPDSQERTAAAQLVKMHGLPALCRALLNASEFLYY